MRLDRAQASKFGALVAGVSLVVAGAVLGPGQSALATSPDVVISQVYGGGGNSGAPLTNDFVELFNRGTSPVTLTGWTVQYASATGTSWAATALTGTIEAGHYYLVQEAAGATPASPLPTPDATGTLAMSASAGKIALVTDATLLTCGTGCSAGSTVRDLIGYGSTASSSETAPTANLSNATAALRAGDGATDTDNNAADFTVAAPAPRNSATGGGGGSTPTPTPSTTPSPTPTPTPTPTLPPLNARIHDIQGAAQISPLKGRTVLAVPGVVFARSSSGFWMQDPTPDSDDATSEGIFVFTGSAPTVAVQDSVTVNGVVSEFRPGGSGGSTNLTTTEIGTPTVTILAHNAKLPAATVIGNGSDERMPPSSVIDDDATGDVETSGTFDADTDGIDFWESLEGMRVQLNNPVVVGPTNSFGELFVAPSGSGVRSHNGGLVATAGDFNPERVEIDDVLAPTPVVDVGDKLTGKVIGPLDYSFGNYSILPTSTPVVHSGNLTPDSTKAATSKQLAVATFNVENLAPSDPQAKFDGLAGALVNNLQSPDLVALEEIQDNDGATDDGVVAADQTMAKLIAAITAAGGPSYAYREIDPVNDADGGQPGGNIRQVFLYRTDRGLAFVDRPGGDSTTADSVVDAGGGVPALKFSPGRIDPAGAAWTASRKPLAGEFTFRGHTLFVIANHFLSKGADQPLFGHFQPPAVPSEVQRHQQADEVKGFVDAIQAVDADADVIVLGDLNDFDFSQTTSILVAGGTLIDLPATLPVDERYTYVYQGNSEVLDHILLSPALSAAKYKYQVVHINSEFATQLSDHDPQVVRLPF